MANTGVAPPNFATLPGQVRLLVGDTDASNVSNGEGTYAWFSDDELTAFGTLFGENPRRVAIQVLTLVSISRALLLGKWSSDDLSVDGPAILSAMEKTIKRLQDEIDNEVSLEDEDFLVVGTGTSLDFTDRAEGTQYPYLPLSNWVG